MDLVTGAMGNLAPKLLQLLQAEYKLQKGVKKQVEFVSEEMESIRAALHQVGKVPPDQLDEQVRIWARQVREASYDMEDVLDTFLVRVEEGGHEPNDDQAGRLKRAMKKMGALFSKGKARHDIAIIIQDIKEKLQEVAQRRDRYRIDEVVPKPEGRTSIDPRLSALYTNASDLIGINASKQALIKMLSIGTDGTSSKKKIVSVVGSGGLGKTTLAKAAYEQVTQHFDCCAFVQVGQNPDTKKILTEILIMLINYEMKRNTIPYDKRRWEADGIISEHLDFLQGKRYTKYTGADLMGLEEHDLIREIHEFLEGKRYLIVVDDIWDRQKWENIKLAFVESNRGSRIVATSRNSQISEKIGDEVYNISKLSDHNSRKLFSARICDKKGEKCPDIDNLDEISDKIIRKCDGVPLFIIAVASVLATKPRNEWSDVYKSVGFGHDGDNIEASNMKKILSFSYYDLCCEIRTCMLYLSVFPEDHYVDKNMLVWRWIAEGLVPTKEGKGLFEVGEEYFHELVNRGLILPLDEGGIVDGCRVHDFVLDLIRELSREQNFVTTLAGSNQEQSVSLPEGGKVRRLALQNMSDTIVEGCLPVKVDKKQIGVARSFNAISSNMLGHIAVAGFKHMRVLALEYCWVEEGYLEGIGKLHHLRYLGLTGTPVGRLPEGVGNLKFLQTLMLHGTGLKVLPESLEQRTELMCLRADETTEVPQWIGKLTSLEELEMYPAGDSGAERFVKELRKLRRLRVLKTEINLQDGGQAREMLESLSKLGEIEIVDVGTWQSEQIELTEEGVMQQLDSALDFMNNNKLRVLVLGALKFPRLPLVWIDPGALPRLCRLKLDLSKFEQQQMDTLGGFPNLRSLQLTVASSSTLGEDDIITCGDGRFHNLVTFEFLTSSSMMIKFVPGAMPRLADLRFTIALAFDKEAKLVLDYGLENLRSLERAEAIILCVDCFPAEVGVVEAAVRSQVLGICPNNNNPPTLSVRRWEEDATGTIDPKMMLLRQEMERLALNLRCRRVWTRHGKQALLFTGLIGEMAGMLQDWRRSAPRYVSHENKVHRIWEECMDTLENAFHGRILQSGGVNDTGVGEQFWAQHLAKQEEISQFVLKERDVHEMMEYIATLEAGLEILTTAKYQRLAALWEEVQAEHSLQVQPSLQVQVQELEDRLNRQYEIHKQLFIQLETIELLPADGMTKLQVLRFMDQWYDTTKLAFHGRILWSSELGAEDYYHEVVGLWERQKELFKQLSHYEDTNRVWLHIAALDEALDVLISEYPRLAKMWEELQTAEDGLLPARMREEELGKRLGEQLQLYDPLIFPSSLDELVALSGNKLYRYLYESWDRVELAVHGRIMWRSSELGDEDHHPDYMNQGRDRVSVQLKAKLPPFLPDRGVHQVTEHIATLERALEVLATEYPRMAAMWEELQSEISLVIREDSDLSVGFIEQLGLYCALISPQTFELIAFDKVKVLQFVHQCYDTMELALHGRTSWRSELRSDDYDGDRDYIQERNEIFNNIWKPKFITFKVDPDLGALQLKEKIAIKEAVVEKLTVDYPRLAAMLEGLKAELRLPAAEDEGSTDTMANNVNEEPKVQEHCLSDQ